CHPPLPWINLCEWCIECRLLGQVQTEVLYIAHDANDCHPVRFGIAGPADSLAEGILVRKILADHHFVDDTNQRRMISTILRTEVTTRTQWNLHGVKVITEDAARLQAWFISRRNRRASFN